MNFIGEMTTFPGNRAFFFSIKYHNSLDMKEIDYFYQKYISFLRNKEKMVLS